MVYVRYMEKMMKDGVGYAETEGNRLKRMLSGSANSIQPEKKDDFQQRLNVVESFTPPEEK